MPDPWVAVEATARRSEKLAALPSDTARWGWLVMLGEAKLLRRQGTFSAAQWTELMGRYSKYLADYIAKGLVHKAPTLCEAATMCMRGRGPFPDGTLVIHDWPRHQREHAVRQSDYESRQTDSPTDTGTDAETDSPTDSKTDTPSRALSLSNVHVESLTPGVGSGEGVGFDLFHLIETLTNRPFGYSPGSKVMSTLAEDVKALGEAKVEAAIREEHAAANGRPLDGASLVFGAHKRLYPFSEGKPKKANSAHLSDLETAVEVA